MDLLEYQAKELFHEIGIPVLPSQRIDRPSDLKGLKIPYPVVLKSQVPIGGRGRAGGIKFVENTIDAIAAAQTIFHLPIMGAYPEVLLAEARYDAHQEFYLAVTLDYVLGRPILLGSSQGGVDVEAVIEKMQQVVVDQEFSPFYARCLAIKMGLQGELLLSVSAIIEKMFKLFVEKDLDLVEINPLGVSSKGEVMALDGKVTVNDAALGRHPDLAILGAKREKQPENATPHLSLLSPHLLELKGNIAVVCNGMGLALATLDLIYQGRGIPARYLNLGEQISSNTGESLSDRLERGLELLVREDGIQAILVNILADVTCSDQVADAIANYLERNLNQGSGTRAGRQRGEKRSREASSAKTQDSSPQFIVRLAGSELHTASERLVSLGVHLVDTLDEGVAKAVSLGKQ